MTAETLTSARAAASFPTFKAHGAGLVHCAWGTYEVAANVEDGDIFEMCKVPAGARIIGGWFYADDLDTGTEALDMDVGWAANGGSGTYDTADVDGLANLGVLTGDVAAPNHATAAGLIYGLYGKHFGNGDLPYFTRETILQVEANVAAETFTAGAMTLLVLYVVDESLVA